MVFVRYLFHFQLMSIALAWSAFESSDTVKIFLKNSMNTFSLYFSRSPRYHLQPFVFDYWLNKRIIFLGNIIVTYCSMDNLGTSQPWLNTESTTIRVDKIVYHNYTILCKSSSWYQ